jgi:hypothetical protein
MVDQRRMAPYCASHSRASLKRCPVYFNLRSTRACTIIECCTARPIRVRIVASAWSIYGQRLSVLN